MKIILLLSVFSIVVLALPFPNSNTGIKCGISNSDAHRSNERIIGGNIVNPPHKYPWMISIHAFGHHICGGTIISETLILTAGHCVYGALDISLYAGLFDQNKTEQSMKLDIKWTKAHHNFKFLPYDLSYDFGLIKLDTPINFSQNVRPICLPTSNKWENYQGDAVTAGWGHDEPFAFAGSEYLQEITLPFVPNPKCVVHHPPSDVPDYQATKGIGNETMVCAGYEGKGHPTHKTVCGGDSGGPLMIRGVDGVYTQVGITSWGSNKISCSMDAGVFSRVTAVLDWIRKYM